MSIRKKHSSRRAFLQTSLAGATVALPGVATAAPVRTDGAAIEAEIHRRAAWHRAQRRLVVDYYRIRRTLAYPLPARSLAIPGMAVPSISEYPWPIWMSWALEERIYSLAWSTEWKPDEQLTTLVTRDLTALTAFPRYCQLDRPDLTSAHCARLMWTAYHRWKLVDGAVKETIQAACARHVEELTPLYEKHYQTVHSKADLAPLAANFSKLHNIPLIGTIGAALSASVINHPGAAEINRIIGIIFQGILDARASGYSEGVGYDGYVLDFIADWLSILPAPERDRFLNHPHFDDCLEESYRLSVPGAMEQVAELGDVEPREMPFHQAAQVKLARWRPTPLRGWFLGNWPPARMRADALGNLRDRIDRLPRDAPNEPAANAHYAVVLRSGWQHSDLAAAMSATNSPTAHLPPDNGTLVIGSAGKWILADPGYEQYMQDEERVFTLGPAAHNYPLINGRQQTSKKPKLVRLDAPSSDLCRATIDLAACYPAPLNSRTISRHLWRAGNRCVLVADQLDLESPARVVYHWHGHPEAAWWSDSGQLLLSVDNADLWFASPGKPLELAAVSRLAGSRGQLTAIAAFDPAPAVIWWVFSLGRPVPQVAAQDSARALTLEGRTFSID